jgi:hypothetical protein
MNQIEKLRNEIRAVINRIDQRMAEAHRIGLVDNIEQWRLIDRYHNYECSSHGRVRNNVSGRVLKLCENSRGYFTVRLCKNGKALTRKVHKLVAEAFIDNPNDKKCVDHIDRNKKNNYRYNLRWSSSQENSRNRTKQSNTSSQYIGVSWYKQNKKWCARIRTNEGHKHLGYFDDEEEAARCYDTKAKEIDPVFWKLNFPE